MGVEELIQRTRGLELVAEHGKPFLAEQAVNHIIAIPDMSIKLESLLQLSRRVNGKIKEMIDAYVDEYSAFVKEVKEKYPEITEIAEVGSLLDYIDHFENKDLKGLLAINKKEVPPRITQKLASLENFVTGCMDDFALEDIPLSEITELFDNFKDKAKYECLSKFAEFLFQHKKYKKGVEYAKASLKKSKSRKNRNYLISILAPTLQKTGITEPLFVQLNKDLFNVSKGKQRESIIDTLFKNKCRAEAVELIDADPSYTAYMVGAEHLKGKLKERCYFKAIGVAETYIDKMIALQAVLRRSYFRDGDLEQKVIDSTLQDVYDSTDVYDDKIVITDLLFKSKLETVMDFAAEKVNELSKKKDSFEELRLFVGYLKKYNRENVILQSLGKKPSFEVCMKAKNYVSEENIEKALEIASKAADSPEQHREVAYAYLNNRIENIDIFEKAFQAAKESDTLQIVDVLLRKSSDLNTTRKFAMGKIEELISEKETFDDKAEQVLLPIMRGFYNYSAKYKDEFKKVIDKLLDKEDYENCTALGYVFLNEAFPNGYSHFCYTKALEKVKDGEDLSKAAEVLIASDVDYLYTLGMQYLDKSLEGEVSGRKTEELNRKILKLADIAEENGNDDLKMKLLEHSSKLTSSLEEFIRFSNKKISGTGNLYNYYLDGLKRIEISSKDIEDTFDYLRTEVSMREAALFIDTVYETKTVISNVLRKTFNEYKDMIDKYEQQEREDVEYFNIILAIDLDAPEKEVETRKDRERARKTTAPRRRRKNN